MSKHTQSPDRSKPVYGWARRFLASAVPTRVLFNEKDLEFSPTSHLMCLVDLSDDAPWDCLQTIAMSDQLKLSSELSVLAYGLSLEQDKPVLARHVWQTWGKDPAWLPAFISTTRSFLNSPSLSLGQEDLIVDLLHQGMVCVIEDHDRAISECMSDRRSLLSARYVQDEANKMSENTLGLLMRYDVLGRIPHCAVKPWFDHFKNSSGAVFHGEWIDTALRRHALMETSSKHKTGTSDSMLASHTPGPKPRF